MAKEANNIIIVRKKKGGHGGHHGGAWKVAYADFVTAMMAFFLLLWLLNVTTDVERKGLADYFAPTSVSSKSSGAGGVMGGRTISMDGAQTSDTTAPGLTEVLPPYEESENPQDITEPSAGAENKSVEDATDKELEEEQKRREEELFKQAEETLKKAIMADPDLKEFANNIIIDQTPEGLRIQIVDQDRLSMFPSGSAQFFPEARALMKLVARIIAKLPNKISISGHTDNTPFGARSTRDNWDLSAERANESRRVLREGGVSEERVANVVGRAEREPLLADKPDSPQNRRISVILLRKKMAEAEAAQTKIGNPADAEKLPGAAAGQ